MTENRMDHQINGLKMAYEDTGGAGIPLLLIHGFPLDRSMWRSQVQGLANIARVIAPDLRGFGESDLPARAVTLDTYAGDLVGLLDALHIQTTVVAGLSMGGYIALAFYRQYASRVRALILADTRAAADSPEAKAGRNENIALARDRGVTAIAERMLPKMLTPQTLANTSSKVTHAVRIMMARQPVDGTIAALIAMRDRSDATPVLAQITVPTLIVAGKEDTLVPTQIADSMHQAIRGSTLVIIADAAHLVNMEQPEAFNQTLRQFFYNVRQ